MGDAMMPQLVFFFFSALATCRFSGEMHGNANVKCRFHLTTSIHTSLVAITAAIPMAAITVEMKQGTPNKIVLVLTIPETI